MMKNMKKTILMIGGLLMMLSACKNEQKTQELPPVKVEVLMIDSVESGLVRTYVGTVEENLSAALSFATGGTVQKVMVHEGDYVRQGTLLVSIDKQNAQSAYDAAKATLNQAEDGYQRLKKVYDKGSIAEVKWVEMQTNLEKARSMEKLAKKQLEECDLYAPFAGVVSNCHAEAGGRLLPGEPALNLLDMHQVAVTFAVPENEIAAVALGKRAKVCVPALNDYTFYGTVSEKNVTSNPISHSYQVKIGVENGGGKLLPGMVCKVMISQASDMGYILPAKAVQTRPEGLSVWVVRDGHAERQLIEVTEYVANGVRVTQGLEQGDVVVVAGQQKLYDNAVVDIQK